MRLPTCMIRLVAFAALPFSSLALAATHAVDIIDGDTAIQLPAYLFSKIYNSDVILNAPNDSDNNTIQVDCYSSRATTPTTHLHRASITVISKGVKAGPNHHDNHHCPHNPPPTITTTPTTTTPTITPPSIISVPGVTTVFETVDLGVTIQPRGTGRSLPVQPTTFVAIIKRT